MGIFSYILIALLTLVFLAYALVFRHTLHADSHRKGYPDIVIDDMRFCRMIIYNSIKPYPACKNERNMFTLFLDLVQFNILDFHVMVQGWLSSSSQL